MVERGPQTPGNPPIRPGGAVTAGCGADLTLASTLRLPPRHPDLGEVER
ncbi:hypothetical protein [Streptomyces sp. 769]|nr:hypothetical protein [Streptomyces sp. 769]